MNDELATYPCQARCQWHTTGEVLGERALFRCSGCLSEWTVDEQWTPINADGNLPKAVAEARAEG